VDDLVSYLDSEAERSSGLRKCLLRMDITAVECLWESWARGKECGELLAGEINFEKGTSEPGWSKTVRKEPSASINLKGPGRGRFLECARKLIREMEQADHPIGIGNLFCPVNKRRDGFEDSALSASALRKRIQQHLKDAGLNTRGRRSIVFDVPLCKAQQRSKGSTSQS
jgi:hypothetical protein